MTDVQINAESLFGSMVAITYTGRFCPSLLQPNLVCVVYCGPAIAHQARRKCVRCRLHRCFSVGMSTKHFLTDEMNEQRKKRRNNDPVATISHHSPLQPPTKLISYVHSHRDLPKLYRQNEPNQISSYWNGGTLTVYLALYGLERRHHAYGPRRISITNFID